MFLRNWLGDQALTFARPWLLLLLLLIPLVAYLRGKVGPRSSRECGRDGERVKDARLEERWRRWRSLWHRPRLFALSPAPPDPRPPSATPVLAQPQHVPSPLDSA